MDIASQRWKEPSYSKREINDAGIKIRSVNITERERNQALEVIDNWRSAHAYPLHIFYMNLRRRVESRSDVYVAERLKRLESIVGKLKREERMELYRMQDLGGCRMVLPTLDEVYKFSERLQKSRIRHEHKKTNDYIQSPKKSGYRSLHLVYKFVTETKGKEIVKS